jgi:putative addiction module killer protein
MPRTASQRRCWGWDGRRCADRKQQRNSSYFDDTIAIDPGSRWYLLCYHPSVIEIRQYVDRQGRTPFLKWLDALSDAAQARVATALGRLEEGNRSSVKSVGGGVHELRINFGPGYRVYFGWDGEQIVILLVGGSKKRQQAEIVTAKTLWREFKSRKKEEPWY